MEHLIKPKSWGGLVKALSGLFITKENPNGLTLKEQQFMAAILESAANNKIDDSVKVTVSEWLNQGIQVTINYINKLKKKGAITKEGYPHPIFFKSKIIIENGRKDILQPSNT